MVPCILLSILIHPTPPRVSLLQRIFWAFCVYLEAVSVLPQLRVMQNIKVPLPFISFLLLFMFPFFQFFSLEGLFIIKKKKVTIDFILPYVPY